MEVLYVAVHVIEIYVFIFLIRKGIITSYVIKVWRQSSRMGTGVGGPPHSELHSFRSFQPLVILLFIQP